MGSWQARGLEVKVETGPLNSLKFSHSQKPHIIESGMISRVTEITPIELNEEALLKTLKYFPLLTDPIDGEVQMNIFITFKLS